MGTVFDCIAETISAEQMLPLEGKIVLGLSGGADSMTLFAFFCADPQYRRRLVCAHVNHGIRGDEAARDEEFVKVQCARQNIPCRVLHADIPALCRATGESSEACGRRVRYEFFDGLASQPADRIVTAHHADDNAETLLLHLVRGAGLQGLCGIYPVRGKLVRPLLGVTRRQILDGCKGLGIPFVQDATNSEDLYLRNRLRHGVMAALKQENPRFTQNCLRLTQSLQQDEDCLAGLAKNVLQGAYIARYDGLDLQVLGAQHPALQNRVLLQFLRQRGCAPEQRHIMQLRQSFGGGACCVPGREGTPGRMQVHCENDLLFVLPQQTENSWQVKLNAGQTLLPDGRRVYMQVLPRQNGQNDGKIHNLLFKNGMDYAIIQTNMAQGLTARPVCMAESFMPDGMSVHKPTPLRELFRLQKVPVCLRKRSVALYNGERLCFVQYLGGCRQNAANGSDRVLFQIQSMNGQGTLTE